MSVLKLAITLFIIANPIGSCPTIVALIKDYDVKTQQKILLRESFFSMIIAFFFLFLGEAFLTRLNIQNYALTLSGGILIFLISLTMIFSVPTESNVVVSKQPPFIVPIATPLLAGAGLLTTILLYSKKEANDLKMMFAIIIAWIGVTAVLFVAPYLQLLLGKRGLAALEQLMGMLLAMLALQMLVNGTTLFLNALSAV